MNVQRSHRRGINYGTWQNFTICGHNNNIGRKLFHFREKISPLKSIWLQDLNFCMKGKDFDRWRQDFPSAAPGAVRLGYNADNIFASLKHDLQ